MKILLDLQGCQSTGSRNRGIGRYSMSLAQALVREGAAHEFHVLLNAAFPETLEPIRAALAGLVPADRVHVFHVPPGSAHLETPPSWRTRAAEIVRRCAIRQLAPDLVHVSSLFDGLGDDCALFIDPALDGAPTAVTIYDFIPYLYRERYLGDGQPLATYERKLESARRASALLCISASACAEAESLLPDRRGRAVNISSAANPEVFFPASAAGAAARLGLDRPFVMYTGGIDWRKNIDGLVDAFAALPPALRDGLQLAIVCHTEAYARTQLLAHAKQAGLAPGQVVLTGYVSDADLADLYRSCELFVFPSLHEGFGLPALEAMMCGAPVIGSNASSIPEVIGREDALFDPRSPAAMAALMQRALTDDAFRASLRSHAPAQAAQFSWQRTARTALAAMEQARADWVAQRTPAVVPSRPRLAMVSPWPPTPSGIADYSCELVPALEAHYEIELVHSQKDVALSAGLRHLPLRDAGWLRRNAGHFDRIVYQFGNALYHAPMFELLRELPGTVVLHDFYLGHALNWMESLGVVPDAFRRALLRSHGREALEFDRTQGRDAAIARYPVNRLVTERAQGVVVHSREALDACAAWWGDAAAAHWRLVPQLRALAPAPDRAQARRELGIEEDVFLACSFGHIVPSKLTDRLLAAWLASPLAADPRSRLVLVGERTAAAFGDEVQRLVQSSGGRIAMTGYADRERYERYLAAADVAVQLRGMSRGETSRAVLDALAHGLPLVANAHGANAEYPPDALALLPDAFTNEELAAALVRLRDDAAERARLSAAARAHLAARHDPAVVARMYRDAIESFAARPQHEAYWQAVAALGRLGPAAEADTADAAIALDATWRRASNTARGTNAPSPAR